MGAEVTVREVRRDEMALAERLSVEELPDELKEYGWAGAEEDEEAFARSMEGRLRRDGNAAYVAEVAGEQGVAGYVWFEGSDRPFSQMKVGLIYDKVIPSHRRKGRGAHLRQALEASRRRGSRLAGLMVRSKNRAAHSLCEKLGFCPEYVVMTGEEPGPLTDANS